MSKLIIDIKSLGIKITDATPKNEVERLCALHPAVKKAVEKLNNKTNG